MYMSFFYFLGPNGHFSAQKSPFSGHQIVVKRRAVWVRWRGGGVQVLHVTLRTSTPPLPYVK